MACSRSRTTGSPSRQASETSRRRARRRGGLRAWGHRAARGKRLGRHAREPRVCARYAAPATHAGYMIHVMVNRHRLQERDPVQAAEKEHEAREVAGAKAGAARARIGSRAPSSATPSGTRATQASQAGELAETRGRAGARSGGRRRRRRAQRRFHPAGLGRAIDGVHQVHHVSASCTELGKRSLAHRVEEGPDLRFHRLLVDVAR